MQNERFTRRMSLSKLASLAIFCATAPAIAQTSIEPDLPISTAVQGAGYYPTIAEDILLRGAQDSRSLGLGLGHGVVDGPDNRALTGSGLFRYHQNEPDFYERNPGFFRPINAGLGVFTPNDALTLENSRMQNVSFTADGNLGLLTRSFNPDLAHIKAGPLFFDVLWMGAGVVYSDFNGELPHRSGEDDDGWTGFVELGVRGLLRITDSIYISAVANVVYLPFENEVALRFGNNIPTMLFRFNYNDQWGDWEILFYDEFRGITGLEFLVNAEATAIDRAGRYQFGYNTNRANDFYSADETLLVNTVAFYASRPVFDNQWRLGFGISHSDYWRTFSFEDHRPRDWLGLWMQYEGSVIPFAPRISYEYLSNDGYDSLLHLLRLQVTGRITENVSWLGMVGYAATTGDSNENSRFIWRVDLDHSLSQNTRHFLSFGQDYFYNEMVPDTRTAQYIRYSIDQRITARFNARAFTQYSYREESSDERFPLRDRVGAGLWLIYRPLDFTDIRGLAYYEQSDQRSSEDDSSRWLYRLELNQQLSHRVTGNVFYQYEEFNRDTRAFTEHFLGLSLRRYF
jgi:hypothetical protein